MNVVTRAYLAGLFDGEGCVHIDKNHGYYNLVVVFSNNSKQACEAFLPFGGNVYKVTERLYQWRAYSQDACAFLSSILDFLSIKYVEAVTGIDFQCTRELVDDGAKENYRKRLMGLNQA